MRCETEHVRMLRSRWLHVQSMLFSRPCPFQKDAQHLCPTSDLCCSEAAHRRQPAAAGAVKGAPFSNYDSRHMYNPIWGLAKIPGWPKESARPWVCQATWM